ncbi:ABC transporter ATP-binding protein [Moorella naiadis]|uniref:ABC transporter ATP-binding protein n=1 Tax=Moorella naiadis (nom. illeg.) TaxID=3093670 RepID=UPI003D9CA336
MIELNHLTKVYRQGRVKAVDDLNLRVQAGELFGFLGPNGAGKTTTIKMMAGLLTPTSGEVIINGHHMAADPLAAKGSLGFVPDNPDIWEKLTGLEYLQFLADVYRVPVAARQARVEELAATFELQDALGDSIQSYSHGMRQKLVLMGALVHQPPVLILDEPMVGLDPRSAYLLKDILRRHCDAGHTVFFSTHILEVAEHLCDRVGIINKGRLVTLGTMEEIKARHSQGEETLEQIFLEITGADLPPERMDFKEQ